MSGRESFRFFMQEIYAAKTTVTIMIFLDNLKASSFEALKCMNSVNGKLFSPTKHLLSL